MSAETRSVGELLADSDMISRQLLRDADEADPRAVTRSWGEVVESAAELWAALPDPGPGLQVPHEETMQQVRAMNTRLVSRTWDGGWPGEGSDDPRLAEMTSNFDRAADLVRRLHERPDGARLSDAAAADVEASRIRLMHGLYVASHAVGVTLAREVKAFERPDEARARRHSPATVRDFHGRVAAVEQLLGSAIATRWPSALAGEQRAEVDNSRLARSWAAWDLQAHRALAQSPTPAAVAVVSSTQAFAVVGGNHLAKAAALLERADPLEYRDRLGPALETSAHRWVDAGRAWQQVAPHGARDVDPELVQAARELRAAVSELVTDGAVRATPETIAGRVDLAEATRVVHRGVIGSADLARAAQDVATDAPLMAPAKPAQKAAQAVAERGCADHIDASPQSTWISPRDLQRNAHVPLPQVLREDFAKRMGDVIAASDIARNASSSMLRTPPPSEGQSIGRLAAERWTPSPAQGAQRPRLSP